MTVGTNIKWAVSSISLGRHSSHTLERKIQAAAAHGFNGLELVYNELQQHATSKSQTVVESAQQIGFYAKSHSVHILTLNALKNFEGNLEQSLDKRLQEAQGWIDAAIVLETRIIQVPSMFIPQSTGDEKIIIGDLQALADLAAQHGLEVAYEAVAFAKYNSLWQDSLRITRSVKRSNFRICLDSYHIHSRLWGDACAESGRLPGGDGALKQSMTEFLTECPKDLVSYIQLSDASRWNPPLSMNNSAFDSLEIRDARLLWSRTARPFPFEEPGYFPVADIAKTWLVEYAWDGWVSLEGFLTETTKEECGPEVMAKRARLSVDKVLAYL